MYVSRILTFLLMVALGSSCVPKPTEQQVGVSANVAGSLSIAEGTDLGKIPVSQVYPFTITIRNPGKLDVNFESMVLADDEDFIKFVGGEFPGTDGTCEKSLRSKETCTLSLQAFGNEVGTLYQSYSMKYTNGIGDEVLSGKFKVYMGREANIEVVGDNKYNFGIVEPFTSEYHVLTVKNTGDLPAKDPAGFFDPQVIADNIFHFKGDTYPGSGGTCGNIIEGGDQCRIVLSAFPIEAGRLSKAKFKLSYKNPTLSKTFSYDLEATSAEMKAYLIVFESDTQVGDVLNQALPGDEKFLTWTLYNDGLVAATSIAITDVGDIPLIYDSTTCPVLGLEPKESCTITYKFAANYPEPLTSPQTFPIRFNNRTLTFSYNDGKYIPPATTAEFTLTAQVKGEAHLNFYQNADLNRQFDSDPSNTFASDIWPRVEWEHVIGTPSTASHSLRIMNSTLSARKKATSISYQLIPNDGMLKIGCITANNCPSTMESGSAYNMPILFEAQYVIPYLPEKDYILRTTYYSGRRTKSYDLTIQTKSEAKPIIRGDIDIRSVAINNVGSVLAGKSASKTFMLFNDGPIDYTPSLTFTNAATLANFSFANNTCAAALLKNGSSCTFDVTFTKGTWNSGLDQTFQAIAFDNGLDPSSINYESYTLNLVGEVVGPGYLEFGGTSINFGNVPWSTTGQTDKVFTKSVSFTKGGGWKVSEFEATLTGPDADLFTIETPSSEQAPIVNGDYNPTHQTTIKLTSPPLGSNRSPLNATLVVKFYGKWEADFAGFEPADVIYIPIVASPQNEPFIIFTSTPTGLGPVAQGLTDSSTITFTNTGQSTATGNFGITHNAFEILNPISSGGCTVNSITNSRLINIQLNAGDSCTFDILFTSTGAGAHASTATVTYSDSDDPVLSSSVAFNGDGLALAQLAITPANFPAKDYNGFGDLKFGDELTKTFTITNSAANSAPAEIISATLISLGAGNCTQSATVPTEWLGISQVDGANNDFIYTSNNCTAGLNVASASNNCQLSVKFSPLQINKLIGACVQIEYRQYPGAPTTAFLRQRLLGRGLAPDATFNGWYRILSEGETDQANPFIKLQWKPMSVVDNLGTVSGYNIYRRIQGTGIYSNIPLNAVPVSTTNTDGYYEYTDNQSEATDDYPDPLVANSVYQYIVKPIVTIPGVAGTHETSTSQADREVRVVLPAPYATLVHRWTANIIACTEMLGKVYSDLNRSNHYSCTYSGHGSSGGSFDNGKDLIIDRYENGKLGSDPTNNPVPSPHLYSDLEAARASCTSQVETIDQLTISNRPKRLINRRDYMLASFKQSSTGCAVDTSLLDETGRNTCKSLFGIEDMIGNAWDIIDAEIQIVSGTTWRYLAGHDLGTQNWRFAIPVTDFNNLNLVDTSTFMDKVTYSSVNSPCVSELAGAPMRDNAGVCPAGSKSFATFGPSMGLNPDRNYILTLNNTSEAFAEWEGNRMLFAGGSYSSRSKFNIEPNRFTTYWTDGYIDTIMQSYLTPAWEGGAARCVLEVPY